MSAVQQYKEEAMKTYRGKGVSDGIAMGKIWVYQDKERAVPRRIVEDVEEEMARYERAKTETLEQLQDLYEKAIENVGEETASIFDVHQMMLEDRNYNESVENLIRGEQMNAEYAVAETGAYFAKVFAAMEDEYIRERAVDIQDVSDRIVGILRGAEGGSTAHDKAGNETGWTDFADEPVIIVAEDLLPSQTVQFDREKVLALVTVKGSATSHTAILAKTMGIPAIVGVDMSVDELTAHLADQGGEDTSGKQTVAWKGCHGAVDGTTGLFYIEPDEEISTVLATRREAQQSERVAFEEYRGLETVTSTGRKIQLGANVGSLKDLEIAIENDAEGIGLFRSEFLYLERENYPTEEQQFQIYKQAVEAMQGKSVIIRTLDIGADKQCHYMDLASEKNPTLGCRGIRVCLTRPEIFKTQIRALLRAAVSGNLKIMYPMITSLDEIRQIKELVQKVKDKLTAEGVAFGEPMQGIMIETPAAALISDELAKEVDFFSIGTNDLTQYTLACDRENGDLDRFYDAHHPAVLRLIAMTVENAHKAGITVGICGELAGDMTLTEEWIKLGIDGLSVAPVSILPLRGQIRKL